MTKIITLILFIVLLIILERVFPLRARRASFASRLFVNLAMSVLTYVTAWHTVSPMVELGFGYSSDFNFGFLKWLSLPSTINFVVGFLLLDWTIYFWHRVNHKVGLFWRFHNVHHYDQDLDVTTSFRFHFGEIAYSSIFRFLQILIIGVPPGVFAVYELVFQAATFFHHSNLRLPIALEKTLNILFVTPRMHGIHHSQVHGETDSNYSVIFSLWDRIHKTFVSQIPQDEIQIGVSAYDNAKDQNLSRLLINPFVKQKNYFSLNQRRKTTNSSGLSLLIK